MAPKKGSHWKKNTRVADIRTAMTLHKITNAELADVSGVSARTVCEARCNRPVTAFLAGVLEETAAKYASGLWRHVRAREVAV